MRRKVEKLRQRALEADAGLERLHFRADAGDFLQADLVDLLGRQVGRRVFAREIRVGRRAGWASARRRPRS